MSVGALKIIIVLLLIAVVASLTSGLLFLIKDMGVADSKRTLTALAVRITLAAALLGTIGYGIASGKLHNTAPWAGQLSQPSP